MSLLGQSHCKRNSSDCDLHVFVFIVEVKIFTSTYENVIQTAGNRDGDSHCAKLLSVLHDTLDTSVTSEVPEVIIKIDILR